VEREGERGLYVHVEKGRLFIFGLISILGCQRLCVLDSKDIFREIESKRIDCFRSVDPEPQPESVLVPTVLIDVDFNLSPKSVKMNTAANDHVICQ
jgi:hypothetical protein